MFRRLGAEWFVAARLLASGRRSYVSLVAVVSTLGLALGVASLVIIFSVTSGFEDVFRDKILGVYPHLVVIGRGGDLPDWNRVVERLSGQPHMVSATPATYDEMMASFRGRSGGCIVKGMDVADERVAAVLAPFLTNGGFEGLSVEPSVSCSGQMLRVGRLPGGSRYVVAAGEGIVPIVSQALAEEEEFPRFRVVSALERRTDVILGNVLADEKVALAPGGDSGWRESPEMDLAVTVGGEKLSVPIGAGNQTIVLGMREGRASAWSCPSPQPESTGSPARLCVVNVGSSSLEVGTSSGTRVVRAGEMVDIEEPAGSLPGVLLGVELAERIGARMGDEVRLVSPLFSIPGISTGRREGRTIADTFVVRGTLALGFYEYDSKLAVVDFNAARRFLHQGDLARWVEVRVDDLFASETLRVDIGRYLSRFSLLDVQERFPALVEKYARSVASLEEPRGPGVLFANVSGVLSDVKFANLSGEMAFGLKQDHRVITWEEMNRPLFSSMKRQRIVLTLFFLIIIVVAAPNVVSSQMMIVREKSSDIAILKAMGATSRQIGRVFLLQGLGMGLLGTLAGLGLAAGLCVLLDQVGFPLDPMVYFVSKLPIKLRLADALLACAMSLVAIYVAVSVAARRAAERDPVEGLRELE
ncbi:MAG: ABC transporter permease [Deltaproteobacteria bacterium]|nr:ABC transporter permease [Deltaproteobacteria bacterium]